MTGIALPASPPPPLLRLAAIAANPTPPKLPTGMSATRLTGGLAGLQWSELETQVLGEDAGYGGELEGGVTGWS